jgi:opine dehydrogenase
MEESSRRAVGVVGTGNSARALACYLASRGHEVHLLVRHIDRFPWLTERLSLTATGKVEGTFALGGVTDRADRFAAAVGTIFVATVATAYRDVAARLAPHLDGDHRVVLFSSKLCGSVEVEHALREHGVRRVPVLETDALFACRIQEDHSIWVRGFKGWTLFSAPRHTMTRAWAPLMRHYFPGLEAARNVIQRGLTDFGALAHPTTMVANMNRVDRQEPFLFYHEGFTEKTVAVLEEVEKEFRAVAHAYEAPLIAMKDLLDRYYGCDASSLLTAMRTVPNYRLSWAPNTLDHRYLKEDVSCTLVPMQQLARKARIELPVVSSIVQMACDLTGEDLVAHGRTLARLGWESWSHAEIVRWIEG